MKGVPDTVITAMAIAPYGPPSASPAIIPAVEPSHQTRRLQLWALKRGDEAVLDESRKSTAIVSANTEIAGLLPRKRKVIYHPVDNLKAANPAKTMGPAPMSNRVRATPIGKH